VTMSKTFDRLRLEFILEEGRPPTPSEGRNLRALSESEDGLGPEGGDPVHVEPERRSLLSRIVFGGK